MFNFVSRPFCAVLCMALCACNQPNDKRAQNNDRNNIGTWKLVKDGDLKIPVDSISPNTTYVNVDYFKHLDSNYIAVTDQRNNNLNIYNLDSKRLSKRIHFETEGRNGIGHFYIADFKSFDSILVRGDDHHTLYLMDSSGKRLTSYELKLPGFDQSRELWFSVNNKPIILNDQIFGVMNLKVKSDKYVFTDLPVYHYSLKEAKVQLVKQIRFPADYMNPKDNWAPYHWEPSVCRYRNGIAYSFPIGDSVYAYNPNDEKVTAHYVPGVAGYQPAPSIKEPSMEELNNGAKNAYLNYLLRYDPYQNVFYRFVFRPVEKDEKYMDYFSAMLDKPITVQILDADDFSVKGETDLKAKIHYFRDFFIGQDGLYISNNHSANPENSEGFISYSKFKIVK
ncbi:DUF4221 family protein [Chitinophaga agri]|uniref:DUF4221 domain-containing protein n=1 Tax=Chitinophaga agri TaxID=2703787 RepID=A0A6B9ZQQ8_9BACT|nr:DUF4221 family protein [Chitinophaga agri]QHS63533.1 DUF4221 domain-containing protein [Chitinophaga agri]